MGQFNPVDASTSHLLKIHFNIIHLHLGFRVVSFPQVSLPISYIHLYSPPYLLQYPPVSILGQPNPVHIPTSHLLEIHPNIIHPSTPRSPQWALSLRFPHQNPIHPLSSPIRATCPAHLNLLDFITRKIFGEEYRPLSFSLCNFLHSLLPRPFQAKIFSSTPYSQTPSAYLPPTI